MNNRIMNLERIMIKNVSNDELQVFMNVLGKIKQNLLEEERGN
jgi:hypothetical protein